MPFSGCSSPPKPSATKDAHAQADKTIKGCAKCLPSEMADDCPKAPAEVDLPPEMDAAMKESFKNSFPGGKSQERGATIVQNKAGQTRIVNEKSGTSGTMSPDRNVGPDEKIIGTYHTHPYDASEGGHKGVSFSGADLAYANHHKEPIYVDAGDKQFMVTPTKKTNATSKQINDDWNAEFNSQIGKGASMQDASAAATNKVAKKYDMAYYEGKDGKLKKVSC